MEWTKHKDELGFIHTLTIPDEENFYIKVEKSTGGDYFICVVEVDSAGGGELEYADTLLKAKRIAESWITNNTWQDWKAEE